MTRTKNSLKTIYTGFLNKFIQLLLSFISRKLFIDILGVGYLGINGLFADVLSMLSMADLGFGTAMAYTFYKPLAEKDEIKIASLIHFYKKIYNIIAIVVALIGIAVIPFLNNIINLKDPIDNIHLYYIIFLANTVFSYLFIYKSTLLSADQKGYIINRINLIINFIKTVVQILILVLFKNYLLYILSTILFTLVNNIVISYRVNKMYSFIKNKEVISIKDKSKIFKNLSSVFIVKISSVLLTSTDNIIISTFIGTSFVGLYSNYNIIVTQLYGFISILFTSLTASIGNLISCENYNARYNIYKIMQMVSNMISGIVIVCCYFLINDLLVTWLGKDYILDNFTVLAILLNFFLQIVLQPIWSFREASALYLKTKYVMCATAIINIILSIILAKPLGVGGVIIASFISRIVTYFWYEPFLLFKLYFDRNVFEYYKNFFINVAMIIILIMIITPINNLISVSSWGSLFIRGIIFSLITLLIYLIKYFRTTEFQELVSKCKSIFN